MRSVANFWGSFSIYFKTLIMRLLTLALLALFFAACDGEPNDPNSAMDSATVNPVAITNPDGTRDALDVEGSMADALTAVERAVEAGDYEAARTAATQLETIYKGTDTGRQPTSEPLQQTANERFRAKLTEFQLSTNTTEQRAALKELRTALAELE